VDSITAPNALQDKDTSRSALGTIEEAKRLIPVEALAGKHTELRRSGDGLRGCCPVHGGDNPESFSVSPDKALFHCFRCGEGGDVVSLYARLEGHENMKEAAAFLLLEFGFEPPQRPQAWFEKDGRQKPVRDALEEARIEHLAGRIYRKFFEALVMSVDEDQRAGELRERWRDAEQTARMMWASRRGGET